MASGEKIKMKKMDDQIEEPMYGGRKGSVVAERYRTGKWNRREDNEPPRYPTNEEIAKAVQQKVAASAYKSGEVVKTLKKALLPDDGSTTMTFKNEDEVLAYIGQKIILPIWQDPVCGDGNCEWPWEFPSWGRFGCRADCGREDKTTKIAVAVRADFTGHPSISPRVLMANARWNLCLDDSDRRKRGEADLCWFEDDKTFAEIQVNQIESMDLTDGKWYIIVKGDYAGRVAGTVWDLTNSTSPVALTLTPAWEACKIRKRRASSTTTAVRKLLSAYTEAQQVGGEEGKALLQGVIKEVQQLTAQLKQNRTRPLKVVEHTGEDDWFM